MIDCVRERFYASMRAFCFVLCASALPTHAATLYVAPGGSDTGAGTVSAPYATLQAAVNNAKAGDTVALRAGTYSGSGNRDIEFGGKALTVKSDGSAAQTILDCGGSESENHRGFYIHGNGTGVRVEGLTIKNGFPNDGHSLLDSSKQGAGVFVEHGSRAAFVSCIFSNNTGVDHTGGAIQNDGRLTLVSCVFDGNPSSGLRNFGTATVSGCKFQNNTSDSGGGIMNAGLLTLTDCTFTDNTCEGLSGAGGGLYVKLDPFNGIRATVTRCTFTGNQAQDGGAVNAFLVTLTDCIFTGNTAVGSGGGLLLIPNGRSALTRCVFRENKAAGGGGIQAFQFSHLALTNCVFLGNSAENGSGGGVGSQNELSVRFCSFSGNEAAGPNSQGGAIANGGKASLIDCILWNDTAPSGGEIGQSTGGSPALSTSHCDIQGGFSGAGNLKSDPRFAGSASLKSDPRFAGSASLHLGAGSPCHRAGATISGVTTDAEKKPRASPPSIGAYE